MAAAQPPHSLDAQALSRHLVGTSPTVGEADQRLIDEGRHEKLWAVLGASVHRYSGPFGEVTGTTFAVWAPAARDVRVVGDFNEWDGSAHALRKLGGSGVWELFVPDVGTGALYDFEICRVDGTWRRKADPLARRTQASPKRASVVFESDYEWRDAEWMAGRSMRSPVSGPMSIYEVHVGSWRKGSTYRSLATQLVSYVVDLGFTHVELLPVMEHPYGGSWGYQVSSYFAPAARWGAPDDLRFLIDSLHSAGVAVILDWVPAHFPKDDWALARFDGTPLYEHADPLRSEHPEWGTYIFDFGRPQVRNFLVANALFWLEEYHADGLRVDAVESMVYLDYARLPGQWAPNVHGGHENLEAVKLLQDVNATSYQRVPGIVTIAEESTAWPGVTSPTDVGGLGFGFKWNMGWMHDTLDYLAHDPNDRREHHDLMTFAMSYAYAENFVLPLSHDEVVHGKGSLLRKMPGDRSHQLANLRAYLAYMWAHPGKQLLFMGSEFGQDAEWAESGELDWQLLESAGHRGVRDLVRDLNTAYTASAALWELDSDPAGFTWIDAGDKTNSVFSFVRSARDGAQVACIANFAATAHLDYPVGLPRAGTWTVLINSDAAGYAGCGGSDRSVVEALNEPSQGQPASAVVQLPPLATLWLRSPE